MDAVDKESGERQTASEKIPLSVGVFVGTVFVAALLGAAVVAGLVAVSTGLVSVGSGAGDEEPDFGGLENHEFKFPSKSVTKRYSPRYTCISEPSNTTLPSAQIVGRYPPFYTGTRTRNISSLWYPITGPGTSHVWMCTGTGFVRGGVYIDEEEYLTVPVSGMYYIYAQMLILDHWNSRRYFTTGTATLKRTCIPGWRCVWSVLNQSIMRKEKLQDSVFHAGIYKLDAGDKIGIQVLFNREPPPLVKLSAVHTYYGLYLIDRTD